jgi:hypothetical protein
VSYKLESTVSLEETLFEVNRLPLLGNLLSLHLLGVTL